MKVLPKTALFAVILTSALSVACSSSTDTPVAADDEATESSSTVGDDDTDTGTSQSTDQQPPATDQEADPTEQQPPNTDEQTDPADQQPPSIDEESDTTNEQQAATEDELDPADDQPPSNEEEPDLTDEQTTPDLGMLIPKVTEGGDLDRLVRGLTRQVSATLIDLNTRLAEGTELTEQQDICLGTYDPAFGEQLLAVDCERALATGTVDIYVESASFYDTDACNSDISEGTFESCLLQDARITIPTAWTIPETSPDASDTSRERPVPIAGMEIYYAVDNSNLRIENTEGALTGAFRCDLDLTDEIATTTVPVQSCADIIKQTADRIDTLLPEQ